MQFKLRSSLHQTLLLTGALCTAAGLVHAQVQPRKAPRRAVPAAQTVPGELIMQCQPATAQADVTRLAKLVNASQTIALLRSDCYRLVLDAAHQDAVSTANAIAQLKLDPMVQTAIPNRIYSTTAAATKTPNDPRYKTGEQYGLAMINMPQAWALQLGDVTTTIAVLDSGFDPTHEDSPVFHVDSFNATDNSKNIQFNTPANGENDHGVATSGVIGANTNNGKGVAGVIWNRVPILGIKGFDSAGTVIGFTGATLINGYTYVAKHAVTDNITVLNLSLGGPAPLAAGDPEYDSLRSVYDAGVNVIASAGNSGPGAIDYPAGIPWVISVSATGTSKSKLAYYSDSGKVDIAAPGGEQFVANDPNGILVLMGGGGYVFEQGTSFAGPHTSGVTGLLRSVQNVGRDEAQAALLANADSKATLQTQIPDPSFGYGFLDAYASLKAVSYKLEIGSPIGINPTTGQSTSTTVATPVPVQTLRPTVRLHMRGVSVVGGVPQYTVQVQTGSTTQNLITNGVVDPSAVDSHGSLVSDLYVVNVPGQLPEYNISFRYRAADSPISQQQQLIATYTASDPTVTVPPAQVLYDITPYTFPSGVSMVSFPVAETMGDSPDPNNPVRTIRDVLGLTDPTQSAILYRWVNAQTVDATGTQGVQGLYAINGSGAGDIHPELATLHPTDVVSVPTPSIALNTDPTNPNNTVTNANPVGLGYFIKLSSGSAVRSFGRTFETQTIQVPIHEGWNMIGNPFTFPIAFANLSIQKSDGTRLGVPDAATAKLVLPFIYRFVGGNYSFQTLPNGTLYPWESNWIYVNPATPGTVDPNPSKYILNMAPTQAGTVTTKGVRASNIASTRASAVNVKPTVRGAGSWVLQLSAHTTTSADNNNFIGMSSEATTNPTITRAPKPPTILNGVTLGLTSQNGTALYAQDLRSLGSTQTWNVQVVPDQPNSEVSVTWPNAHALPRNYQLTLTDPTTGQTIDLRNRSVYRFNAGSKAAARTLTITATPGQVQDRVQFNSVVVTPRSTGKGTAAIYQIDYTVNGAAQVDVAILGTAGRALAQVDTGRAIAAGDNHVLWNGRDNQNRALAAGTYTVRLRAVTATGKVSQYQYPLTITR